MHREKVKDDSLEVYMERSRNERRDSVLGFQRIGPQSFRNAQGFDPLANLKG